MADPKYANLPGIDTESKDVYECGDLPEEDQDSGLDELNSTSVEVIDSSNSFEKFSGKYVSGLGKDFSGHIQRGKMTGYQAEGSGLVAPGESETVFQKFNRLKIEVAELLNDVHEIKNSKSDKASATNLVQQVQALQQDLADETVIEVSNKSLESGPNVDEIIAKIKSSKTKQTQASKVQDGTYQLFLKPDQQEKRNLRFSELEQRLARLEKVLGPDTDEIRNVLSSHSEHQTLQDAVQTMETKLALLDPDKLPLVDSRLQAILNKVNEINKSHKAPGDQPTNINKKISELYDLVQKWEGVRVGLPMLIDRLRALDVLHSKACDFTSTLAHLEGMQSKITSRLDSASSTQNKLEETFKQNLATVESNLSQLNKRMTALSSK